VGWSGLRKSGRFASNPGQPVLRPQPSHNRPAEGPSPPEVAFMSTTSLATTARVARVTAKPARRAAVSRAPVVTRASHDEKSNVETSSWHLDARRAVAASLCAATLAGTVAPTTALAIDLVIADPSVKQYMDMRDDAMRMKCEGGMMDCDGDRREYAKKQAENFVARNSGEERVLPECKVEEACTENILGAAFAGVQGLTTSEKLEKMGRDGDAINGTRKYFGE
jgi:hypothetical protein